MTTVQITLPDQLAHDAQSAGLLAPELLEQWLREQLRVQRTRALFQAAERMSAMESAAVLSPEAVAEEITAMRVERRTQLLR